jgi:sulfate/thiosulfate-binding protein
MPSTLRRGRITALVGLGAAAAISLTACSSSGNKPAAGTGTGSTAHGGKVAIIAFSVPKAAYDAAEAAFQKTPAGAGVTFSESYGPSGSQSKAVAAGQPADYVGFSLEPDMTKLVPQFVDPAWNSGPTKGLVSSSVVVICVRKGNPKHITGWADLIKPGVKIVTPDPATSGSAKWNILAAYTHILEDGGTAAQAETYLKAFFKNVVAKPTSGSDATTTFLGGTGDVLISYENEAIAARQAGKSLDYIIPTESILIQNPGAVTKSASAAATAWLAYLQSPAGQLILASHGFRPVVSGVNVGTVTGANTPAAPFPAVAKLETIDNLGGWKTVNKEFFDPSTGIVTKIENGSG